MTRQSPILWATDSVIMSASGRPVVPGTSFSQLVSALKFIPTRVSLMSELSGATNIFPGSSMGNNTVR